MLKLNMEKKFCSLTYSKCGKFETFKDNKLSASRFKFVYLVVVTEKNTPL